MTAAADRGAKARRVVMHVDMNAFFAAVEQRSNPALRGRPVAVIGSAERTVVTTSSYEARARGVKTGMSKYAAKKLCPELVLVVGDNRKYVDTSVRILEIMKEFSPVIEVFSIDEAFLDITGTERLFGPPRELAAELKRRILEATGLTCSAGIAPNKLLAKLASGMQKPDGLVEITPDRVVELLEKTPADHLCGVGPRLAVHLARMGVTTCGELGRYPVSILRSRFGIIGERLSMMGRGEDDSPVVPVGTEAAAKSVGHSTTLPADITDRREIRRHLLKLSEMVAARARRYGLKGAKVALTVRYPDFYTRSRVQSLSTPTSDARTMYAAATGLLDSFDLKPGVRLLGVTLSALSEDPVQMGLFEDDMRRDVLLETMDEVNGRFGRDTLGWAALFEEEEGPGVISPSWRPSGVKRVEMR